MKVLELLEEIEEIVENASGVPLTGKVMVDGEELLDIVKEIRAELPDEFEKARQIKMEQERIISDARDEYESVISDARRQAAALVENDDITVKAKIRAEKILSMAEEESRTLKMSTYEYMDSILYNFQEKMEEMNATYFGEMYKNLEETFDGINNTLNSNRGEIKQMAYDLSGRSDDIEVIEESDIETGIYLDED